jgi:WD40 repeat protein
MKFSSDGRRLGTLGKDSSFKGWNLYDGKPALADSRLCDLGEVPVAITADGEWVVTLIYSADGEDPHWVLRRIAISGAERVFATTFDTDLGPGVVHQVAVNPPGTLIAAAIGTPRGAGAVVLGEVVSGKCRWLKQYRDETPKGVAFSEDSKFIVVESNLGHIWVYDVATGTEQLALQSSRPTEDRLAIGGGPVTFDHSGRRIVTAGADGSLRIWDSTLGTELLATKSHKRDVVNVIVSADNRTIATKSRDKTVHVWRGTTNFGP